MAPRPNTPPPQVRQVAGRTLRRGGEDDRADDEEEVRFKNYALPARLVILEFLVFLFLIILLLASPTADGIAAMSTSGGSSMGLLRELRRRLF